MQLSLPDLALLFKTSVQRDVPSLVAREEFMNTLTMKKNLREGS
jgi:hypothetical protein